jgi:predicted MFS family arabinose efflux permease
VTRTNPVLLTMALSVTQVIGWATAFNALAVLARPISEDLDLPLPLTLAGSSVFLVALAFTSRALVPLYSRYGAGRILTMGSVAAAAGFVAVALSSGPVGYGLGWLILGAAGAAMLTAPAHALLVQMLGRDAKRWIAAVMLASGLGASIGLPATSLLLEITDWRGTMLVFAVVHLALCAPLHLWAHRHAGPPAPAVTDQDRPPDRQEIALFRWLAISVSLIGFVTWGFAIVIVELLQASGMTLTQSVTAGALIGVATVAARAAEFAFAPNLQPSRTAIWATAGLCLSLVLLGLGGTTGAWAFVILFGAASGTMSVARATLPLELFDPSAYAFMVGRLALPMYLAFAAAPPVFGLILTNGGARSVLMAALTLSLIALAALITLRRQAQQMARA